MELRTSYMGLELSSPIVASASPLSENVDTIKRMEDEGAAAVVMFSLFEEQIRTEAEAMAHFQEYGGESFAEALSYFPALSDYDVGTERYLDILRQASEQVDIPVFGSLNGTSAEGWVRYARQMEDAGASGIELNVYYIPTEMETPGSDVEQRYVDVLRAVKATVDVPVAIKIGPFFSSVANMAHRLDRAGADGLVLFNRFYQPDFDLETLDVVPSLVLSKPFQMRLPLMWIALLHGRVDASLAATTGVHGVEEVVKYLMAGADVVMTTAALLVHGIGHLRTLREGLREWLEMKGYDSVAQLRGSMSVQSVADPTAFVRANYIKVLENYKNIYEA